jgi:hypothetical protein
VNVYDAMSAAQDEAMLVAARPVKKQRPAFMIDGDGTPWYWSPAAKDWFKAPEVRMALALTLERWEVVTKAEAERDGSSKSTRRASAVAGGPLSGPAVGAYTPKPPP